MGIGRIGGIARPTIGGVLLSMNLTLQENFLAFAVPGISVALAYVFVQVNYGHVHVFDREPQQKTLESTQVNS